MGVYAHECGVYECSHVWVCIGVHMLVEVAQISLITSIFYIEAGSLNLAVSDDFIRQLVPGNTCLCFPCAEIKDGCHTLGILTLILRPAWQALTYGAISPT